MVRLPDPIRRLGNLDAPLLLAGALLLFTGWLMQGAAGRGGDELAQSWERWFMLGAAASFLLLLLPLPRVLSLAPLFYALGLGMLVLVKVAGPVINGSQRWLPLLGRGLQPSEFMKLFTLLMLAQLYRAQRVRAEFHEWLPVLAVGLLPTGLILVQPDLGTSLMFVPLTLAVIVAGGARWKPLLFSSAVAALALFLAGGMLLEPYQKERIASTLNIENMSASQRSGTGYQLAQSLTAVGNGGLFGHGLGEGPCVQAGRLPYHHNDFIFAEIAEETGFVGSSLFVLLEMAFVLLICRVGAAARPLSARTLCAGAAALLGAQAFAHMAVTVALAPTKGLPLPFISAGGSSLLVSMLVLALVQGVSVQRGRW